MQYQQNKVCGLFAGIIKGPEKCDKIPHWLKNVALQSSLKHGCKLKLLFITLKNAQPAKYDKKCEILLDFAPRNSGGDVHSAISYINNII